MKAYKDSACEALGRGVDRTAGTLVSYKQMDLGNTLMFESGKMTILNIHGIIMVYHGDLWLWYHHFHGHLIETMATYICPVMGPAPRRDERPTIPTSANHEKDLGRNLPNPWR